MKNNSVVPGIGIIQLKLQLVNFEAILDAPYKFNNYINFYHALKDAALLQYNEVKGK